MINGYLVVGWFALLLAILNSIRTLVEYARMCDDPAEGVLLALSCITSAFLWVLTFSAFTVSGGIH